jgi:hypothetical protein
MFSADMYYTVSLAIKKIPLFDTLFEKKIKFNLGTGNGTLIQASLGM